MSGSPDLAIRLHGMIDPGRSAELAAAAENSGFRTVWFAENLFQRGVLPAASASAVATRSIGIGIGVFNPFNRHPSLMAMEAAALDELSDGRAILGIGVGVPPQIDRFAAFERPLAAMHDTVAIARAMLAGETVTHRGAVFSADGIGLGFDPPRADMSIQIAAMGPKMLRLAGEIGDGVLISNMCPPAFTGRAVALAAEGAEEAGRAPPGAVVKYVPCVVDSDRAAARRAIKPAIAAMLGGYEDAFADAPDALAALRYGGAIEPGRYAATLDRLRAGEAPETVLDDAFVDQYGIAGSAEDCLHRIDELGADGATEIALTFLGDDAAGDIAQVGEAAGS